jgi:DNA-binding PadR family transcriptional regulator
VVLGLVAGMGPVTPYEMKAMVATSIGYFWSFPHSQLYAESDRLAGAGLLRVDQEGEGRRRKRYSITAEGLEALREWVRAPSDDPGQTRYPGLLQLFFGAAVDREDVKRLADVQAKVNRELLDTYEGIAAGINDEPTLAYPAATLRLGMKVTQACIEFWEEIAQDPPVNAWSES